MRLVVFCLACLRAIPTSKARFLGFDPCQKVSFAVLPDFWIAFVQHC